MASLSIVLAVAFVVARAGDAPAPVAEPAAAASLTAAASHEAMAALSAWLGDGAGEERIAEAAQQPFARVALTREDAAAARDALWTAHCTAVTPAADAALVAGSITLPGGSMRFALQTFGERPEHGHSLWLSMHGGGSAPTALNDQQWRNQQRLYTLDEGIYVAPRAPADAWNMWHLPEVDQLFGRLIELLVARGDVDPDRVYLIGYSAGGDGVFQLAPRMADRFAGAGAFAGHPNASQPDGLRNVAFALHVGGADAAYGRNAIAATWGAKLDELAAADPAGYVHQVVIHEGLPHWMNRQERPALDWLAAHRRDPRPSRLVWAQGDALHARLDWLAVDKPAANARIDVERVGQVIRIGAAVNIESLRIRLDDAMMNLDEEVTVRTADRELTRVKPTRTIATLVTTLQERGDPEGMFSAEIEVRLTATPDEQR